MSYYYLGESVMGDRELVGKFLSLPPLGPPVSGALFCTISWKSSEIELWGVLDRRTGQLIYARDSCPCSFPTLFLLSLTLPSQGSHLLTTHLHINFYFRL